MSVDFPSCLLLSQPETKVKLKKRSHKSLSTFYSNAKLGLSFSNVKIVNLLWPIGFLYIIILIYKKCKRLSKLKANYLNCK